MARAAAPDGAGALSSTLSDELLMTLGWYGTPDDDPGPMLARYRAAGVEHLIARPITTGDPRVALRGLTAALESARAQIAAP